MGEGHVGVLAGDWLPRPVVSSLGTCPRLGLERGALGTPGGVPEMGRGVKGFAGGGSAVSGEQSGAGSSDAA